MLSRFYLFVEVFGIPSEADVAVYAGATFGEIIFVEVCVPIIFGIGMVIIEDSYLISVKDCYFYIAINFLVKNRIEWLKIISKATAVLVDLTLFELVLLKSLFLCGSVYHQPRTRKSRVRPTYNNYVFKVLTLNSAH